MKLSDSTSTPPAILFWGPYGQGKTAFWQTGGSLVQLIDLDNGAKTGLYLQDRWTTNRKASDWVPCLDKPGSPPSAFLDLQAHISMVASQCIAKTFPFKVIVIDSLTTLCDAAMKLTLYQNNNLGGQATQPQWGLAMLKVEEILRQIRVLPICKVVIAHEEVDVVGGTTTMKPSVLGNKLYPKIPPLFDEIVYARKVDLAAGKSEYRIHTSSTSFYSCRTRYSVPNFNMDDGAIALLKLMKYDIEESGPVNQAPGGSTASSTSLGQGGASSSK